MEQTQLLTLIEKSRAGDRQAQEALVMETQKRVYYHCKKMLGHEQDAQDATQDVLITVLTSLDKLREPTAYWGWVNGITANRCKHLLTQGTREWQLPEDEEGHSLLDSLEDLDDQVVPDRAADSAETRRLIMDLIDALPPEQKMTVLFYYYDEMSVKEIAAAMGVSEGTVKSRLNYARKAIKVGVDDLERKGAKLYGVSPLLVLAWLLRTGAQEQAFSPAAANALTQSVLQRAGMLTAAGGGAASSAGGAGASASEAGAAPTAQAAPPSPAATSPAASPAASTAARGAVKAAGHSVGRKIALGLAGLTAAGAVTGGGLYLAARNRAASGPDATPIVETQEPQIMRYNEAYAQQVRDMEAGTGNQDKYRYDLVYINEDDVPELVASYRENGKELVDLYTFLDGSLKEVKTAWGPDTEGSLGYYPGCNVICMYESQVNVMYVTSIATYFEITASGEAETFQESSAQPWRAVGQDHHTIPDRAVGVDRVPLRGALTVVELLAQLEGTAPSQPIEAPAPTP